MVSEAVHHQCLMTSVHAFQSTLPLELMHPTDRIPAARDRFSASSLIQSQCGGPSLLLRYAPSLPLCSSAASDPSSASNCAR